ncbi:MAG: hypothetical protein ACXVWT_18520 [Solirubrobacteraceae bacterium]
MKLGMVLYKLWHTRAVLIPSVVIAVLTAVLSSFKLGPGGIQPRALGMSTAQTQVLVDNPSSIVLDLKQGSYQLQQMAQSATLLGNVLVSIPVQQDIARRAGIPVSSLMTTAPATPQSPSALTTPSQRKTTDIMASNNQYRINVQANPTVPMLTVYTEASSVTMAKALANAAVASLRAYVDMVDEGIPAGQRVNVYQLGRAEGGPVTGGLRLETLALVFFFVLAVTSAVGLATLRVREGWKLYRDPEDTRAPTVKPSEGVDVA